MCQISVKKITSDRYSIVITAWQLSRLLSASKVSCTQCKPMIYFERAWTNDAPNYQFYNYIPVKRDNKKVVNFVSINNGAHGTEHIVAHTNKLFNCHASDAKYDDKRYLNCLWETTHSLWQQTVAADPVYPEVQQTLAKFQEACLHYLDKLCNCYNMNVTLIHWLQYQAKKPATIVPCCFYFHFCGNSCLLVEVEWASPRTKWLQREDNAVWCLSAKLLSWVSRVW